jgi:RNAse (barnase) inhibitor barstar
MQSKDFIANEQYIFYLEIREFDNDLILWSGYCTDNCKISEKQIIFYNVSGKWINQLSPTKKNIYKIYDINLYFLNCEKKYFGVKYYNAEFFSVKEKELSFEIDNEGFGLNYFQIDLIKRYHENKINLRDWYALSEDEKNDWLKISYCVQQYKPMRLTSSVKIDGRYIKSLKDFLCYIGEEINGLMGYFGSSFGSFSDSLTGGIGCITIPLEVTWIHFEETRISFDNCEDLFYLIELLSERAKFFLYSFEGEPVK